MAKTTKPKLFCFVLMPFGEQFDDIYQFGIKESCVKAGAYCERVDEQIFQETILERVYNQIYKADLIIADMTGRNPNVFYEVGYAHALGRPAILLTQDSNDIPFDLKNYPHIVYEGKISELKKKLTRQVKWFVANPNEEDSKSKIEIEIYLDEQNLSSGKAIYVCPHKRVPSFNITIQNASIRTFEPGDLKIGLITSAKYPKCRDSRISTIKMPDGEYLHILPNFPVLFPGLYTSYKIVLDDSPRDGDEDVFVFRLFTQAGSRDYPLVVRKADVKKEDVADK